MTTSNVVYRAFPLSEVGTACHCFSNYNAVRDTDTPSILRMLYVI